ncbi:MAG: hypothetical protein HQM10_15570 [Candidatus Riflebacteria bacterium]|nr:hypothetical protein [Candidatus Riflebacteria bacterium]
MTTRIVKTLPSKALIYSPAGQSDSSSGGNEYVKNKYEVVFNYEIFPPNLEGVAVDEKKKILIRMIKEIDENLNKTIYKKKEHEKALNSVYHEIDLLLDENKKIKLECQKLTAFEENAQNLVKDRDFSLQERKVMLKQISEIEDTLTNCQSQIKILENKVIDTMERKENLSKKKNELKKEVEVLTRKKATQMPYFSQLFSEKEKLQIKLEDLKKDLATKQKAAQELDELNKMVFQK